MASCCRSGVRSPHHGHGPGLRGGEKLPSITMDRDWLLAQRSLVIGYLLVGQNVCCPHSLTTSAQHQTQTLRPPKLYICCTRLTTMMLRLPAVMARLFFFLLLLFPLLYS